MSSWTDIGVSWAISPNINGTWTYTYNFVGLNQPSVSHTVIDITDGIAITPSTISNASARFEFGNFDGVIGSVKFDNPTDNADSSLTFTSDRAPVWGDISLKAGASFARNAGFGNRTFTDASYYVARPDGDGTTPSTPVVPLPSAVWAGLGLLGVLGFTKLRRQDS